jgi:hypothetical protein
MRADEARIFLGAAAMQQVADWLEKLGLGQYAQRFAENDISFSVLPDLTDQDLEDIGVSLGHRRQFGDYEAIFRAEETNKRMRDNAALACRALCRARVAEELQRRRGTRIGET